MSISNREIFLLPLSVRSQFLTGGQHLSTEAEEMHIVGLHPPLNTDRQTMSSPRHRIKPINSG